MSERPSHKLGEVLRTAREAKGVELARVERDTKIRARYLSALERGEYRELPGAVYTKGFLRNYGLYLDLDPEYLVDLYRLETSGAAIEHAAPPSPPRPLAVRRSRAFVVTPGAVVAVLLTVLVTAFVLYLGYEFVNFARTPDLRITQPAGDVAAHEGDTFLIRGVTEPNSRITVSGLPENPTISADEEGNFSFEARLVPGSNVISLVAYDPQTQRESAEVRRTIVVVAVTVTPTPGTVALALLEPADGTSLADGTPLTVAGTAAPGATVTIGASLTEPAPTTFTILTRAGVELPAPGLSEAPAPVTGTVAGDGSFSGSLALPPGRWELRVDDGTSEPITRSVTVTPPVGLSGRLEVAGGQSYLELEQDGTPVAGVSGGISNPGTELDLSAEREIRIRAGNAGAVSLTINGVRLGLMGPPGAVVEWRITRSAP